MHKYSFVPITLVFWAVYLISWYLVNKKMLTNTFNRKIWNYLLLISFVVSGILGLVLLLPNHNIELPIKETLLSLHVQAGFIMFYISCIHLFKHKKYYKIK